MPIPVVCAGCGSKLKAPDHLSGKTLKCPKCAASVTVPAAGGTSSLPVRASPPPPPAQIVNVAHVSVQPAESRCPFCGEGVAASARVCKHCGRTIDPALWAAEEARRTATQAAKSRRDDFEFADRGRGHVHQSVVINQDRSFPHVLHLILTLLTCGMWLPVWVLHYILSSRGGSTLLAFLIGIPVCLLMLSCGGCLVVTYMGSKAMSQEVEDADRLYDSGQQAEAVSKYKSAFSFVSTAHKPEVVRRIVEFELARNDGAEATTWMERALRDGMDVPYESPAAKSLFEATKKDRDAKLNRTNQKPMPDSSPNKPPPQDRPNAPPAAPDKSPKPPPKSEPPASRTRTPAEVAKALIDELPADAKRWMVMYVRGDRLRLAPIISDADLEAVKKVVAREEVKRWIVDEDTRAGHPEGPKAAPIPQPAMSAATAKQRRAEAIAASEAADRFMVKEGFSADAKTWMVMYVNGHLLRNAPLLSQADYSAVKKMMALDEVKKWVAAEDAYAGPKAEPASPPAQPEAGKTEAENPMSKQIREREAERKLKTAKQFLDVGKRQDALDYLDEIIKNWPDTKAATEARELLKKLQK